MLLRRRSAVHWFTHRPAHLEHPVCDPCGFYHELAYYLSTQDSEHFDGVYSAVFLMNRDTILMVLITVMRAFGIYHYSQRPRSMTDERRLRLQLRQRDEQTQTLEERINGMQQETTRLRDELRQARAHKEWHHLPHHLLY